ncbi:hypothetical protein DYB32_007401 [Aphanomyces invadans]|uniref:Uncharacterized protein n=1 Tax=Aphanomyces invadans TaxID=157072 RepID=A0A418AP89_9STRA|nr:hypothetical protein DYB32_007401 [Aphanomyces invadans]
MYMYILSPACEHVLYTPSKTLSLQELSSGDLSIRDFRINPHSYPYCHVKAEIITAGWSLVALLLADGSIKTCHIHCITQTKVYSIASDSRDPIERMVAGSGFSVALSNLGLVYLWHEIGQSESLHFDTDDKLGLRGGRFSHVSARLHNLALVDGATGRLRMFDLNRGREITSTWMDSTRKIAKVSHGNLNGGALLTNVQVWRRGNGS